MIKSCVNPEFTGCTQRVETLLSGCFYYCFGLYFECKVGRDVAIRYVTPWSLIQEVKVSSGKKKKKKRGHEHAVLIMPDSKVHSAASVYSQVRFNSTEVDPLRKRPLLKFVPPFFLNLLLSVPSVLRVTSHPHAGHFRAVGCSRFAFLL